METLSDMLKRGWGAQQKKKHFQAESIYRQVLSVRPGQPVASFLLGRLQLELGRPDEAVAHLAAALRGDASQAMDHATWAEACQALGRHQEAVVGFRAALAREPGQADLLLNLGTSLLFCKQPDEAIASYEQAVQCDPQMAEAHNCLGAAIEHQGRFDDAVAHYRQAIALRPDYAQAHYNLGTAMLKKRLAAEALQSLNTAVQLRPQWDAALANLAAAYHLLGRTGEACQMLERAVEAAPNEAAHHCSLATLLRDGGRAEEALASYEGALAIDPANRDALYGRAVVLLSLGRFAEAWPGFALRTEGKRDGPAGVPEWDGSPLPNKRLMVRAAQGLGDTLQFIRFLKPIESRVGEIVTVVPQELMPLLQRSGFGTLVSNVAAAGSCDAQVALLDLPGLLGTTLETIPAEVPYLQADPQAAEPWRALLEGASGLKVGIAWQGSSKFPIDRFRSIPLDEFQPLASLPGVQLISLQKGFGSEQLSDVAAAWGIVNLDADSTVDRSFEATASLIGQLDLVITSDTSIAHLAGGLGATVWLAVCAAPSWRWLLEGEKCAWYPTMRLFRQQSLGHWQDVFERITKELDALARQRNAGAQSPRA